MIESGRFSRATATATATAAAVFFSSTFAVASKREECEPSSFDFEANLNIDLPVISLSAAAWAVPSLMDKSRNPNLCVPYCDADEVNVWDRKVIFHHNEAARMGSDILVVLLPAQALWLVAADGMRLGTRDAVVDLVILTEVLTVQGGINQIVKTIAARPRPYMYREEGADGLRKHNADDYRSFWSSHTSTVFAVLTGAATILSMRYPKSPLKWPVWTFAMMGGASVAMLRTLAGKHFYTDVLLGAFLGIASGVAIPLLHARRLRPHRKVEVYPAGVGIGGAF